MKKKDIHYMWITYGDGNLCKDLFYIWDMD
jgi:hypothetical protein